MEINIIDYIEFSRMWEDLTKQLSKMDLEDLTEADKKVKDFIKNKYYGSELDLQECQISDESISFTFSEEYQTANESNNQNEWFAVYINYNLNDNCFDYFETENG